MIPNGAKVTGLEHKLVELNAAETSPIWHERATRVLRGGDGGEHGLLLDGLIRKHALRNSRVTALDVGTARGFSAVSMARAMLDAQLAGSVYTLDVVGHDESLDWHAHKHDLDEPLAGMTLARSEIWQRWFPEERALISPITGRSEEILSDWRGDQIDVAFLDGSHAYEDVKAELRILDTLLADQGSIVLDDYHLGVSVARLQSRRVNAVAWVAARTLGRIWPRVTQVAPRPGDSNEYVLVKQRFHGVRKAVDEFIERQAGKWSLEIISMPSRGAYQGNDYSLALLQRTTLAIPSATDPHGVTKDVG